VALRDGSAPASVGGSYSDVGGGSLVNDAGDVSVLAVVSGGSADRGLFVDSEGVHDPVILAGQAAPVPPSGTYDPPVSDLDRHGLSDSGAVTFLSGLSGVSVAGSSIALSGEDAPGADDGTFTDFYYPAVNAGGDVVFLAGADGSVPLAGILLAGAAEAVPGFGASGLAALSPVVAGVGLFALLRRSGTTSAAVPEG